ncbi:MAG TPA: FAD-dependent oxidoreductase [Candidatus Competibacteraceae bacterium]|nr:FAD-dependent oxidoreductase [Candidatus Competibacteraceae bacterium]
MTELYHPSAYDPTQPMASWWHASAGPAPDTDAPAAGDCEVAIIGAGYTGLSCALHLARAHGIEALVLDAGPIGWGASGRNGGFCCMGGAKLDYAQMIRRYGLDDTRRFFAIQRQAVDLVEALSREYGIDVEPCPGGEYELAHSPRQFQALAEYRALLEATFGHATELLPRAALAERGLAGPAFHGGLHNPVGFGLHPLKYAHGLAAAARRHGVRIFTGCPVQGWHYEQRWHHLLTPVGILRARRVVVATAGYLRDRLHPGLAGRLLPALSNILVTRSLSADELAAQGWTTHHLAYDTRQLLHYFRLLPDGRFLFGGRGGLSAAPDSAEHHRAWLTRHFQRMFPAWRGVEISHFWNGLLCLAYDLHPHLGELPEASGVYFALAYHGSGVAMGTWSGRAVAGLVAGTAGAEAGLPRFLLCPPPRFPLPALRKLYLGVAYAVFTLRDRWG